MRATTPTQDPTSGITPTSADRVGSDKLGKNEFLKLLVTQLSNQDPLKPQDSSAFIAQLAQFSTLEQAQGTNSRLDTLLSGQATTAQNNAAAYIGKEVSYATNRVVLQPGLAARSDAHLSAKADAVTVAVQDGSGRTVRTMKLGAQEAGSVALVWDGRDDGGNASPPGDYTFQVTAADANGKSVGVSLRGRGAVTGVSFEGGVSQLDVGGTLVRLSDVTSINERSTS